MEELLVSLGADVLDIDGEVVARVVGAIGPSVTEESVDMSFGVVKGVVVLVVNNVVVSVVTTLIVLDLGSFISS